MDKGEFLIIDCSTIEPDEDKSKRKKEVRTKEEVLLTKLWSMFGSTTANVKRVASREELLNSLKWFNKYLHQSKPSHFVIALLGAINLSPKNDLEEEMKSKTNLMSLRDIKELFLNNLTCPVMAGKPKLFLYQELRSESGLQGRLEWQVEYVDQRFKHFKNFMNLLIAQGFHNTSHDIVPQNHYARYLKYSKDKRMNECCNESSFQSNKKRKDKLVSNSSHNFKYSDFDLKIEKFTKIGRNTGTFHIQSFCEEIIFHHYCEYGNKISPFLNPRIITKWKMSETREATFPTDGLYQTESEAKYLTSDEIQFDSFSCEEDDDTLSALDFDIISHEVKVRDERRIRRGEMNLSIILPSVITCSIILNLQKIFIKLVKKDQTFLQIFWISFLLTFANALMLIHYYYGVRQLNVPNFYEAGLFSMVFAFITCLINCGRNN